VREPLPIVGDMAVPVTIHARNQARTAGGFPPPVTPAASVTSVAVVSSRLAPAFVIMGMLWL
jgi:hypothetical protein